MNDMNQIPVVILNRTPEALGQPRRVPAEATEAWSAGAIEDACAVADAADLKVEVRHLGAADQSPSGYHRIAAGVHEADGYDTATAALMAKAIDEAAAQEIAFWTERTYHVAVVKESGDWDIIDTFTAADDDAANAYAEQNHDGIEWYVLDDNRRNINGGVDR